MTTVPHYHVEYCVWLGSKWVPRVIPLRDPGDAEEQRRLRDGDKNFACLKITGPHPHDFPDGAPA